MKKGFGLVGLLVVIAIVGVVYVKFFDTPLNSGVDGGVPMKPLDMVNQAQDLKGVLESNNSVVQSELLGE